MNPYLLQTAVMDLVKEAAADIQLKKPQTDENTTINVFRNRLPVLTVKDEDPVEDIDENESYEADESETSTDENFPFAIVQLEGGTIATPQSEHRCRVTIVFGVYEPDEQNTGDSAVSELIQRTAALLIARHSVGGWYVAAGSIGDPMVQWELSQDDNYPYFFGGMSVLFATNPPKNRAAEQFT